MTNFSYKKIIPGIALLLILAATGGGLALSHWTDQTAITGSMSSGTLEWDITPTALGWNTNTVMEFDVDVDYEGDGPGETGLIAVDLENAYPNGYGAILLIVRNEGTIPVHVTFWFDATAPSCTNDALLDYILVNPAFDAPFYNGQFDYSWYSIAAISAGWTDPWTQTVTWWNTNHGSMATQLALEDIMASGQVLKIDTSATTIMQYDDDTIIMPGEKHAIFLWIGLSDDLQEHEELMGESCTPAFVIHYYAVQALP
ncbi:MAG: hypothetical protein F7C37_01130 [Desulfurococcales archaeon]|nr:hypothetical protein [Desulfurococcales archaeon]MCE4622807.1 hypothetical protein [Desulfurococcales archaeon]MCE4626124.1 hypothetical protein [Desulfurococcales archaeon]